MDYRRATWKWKRLQWRGRNISATRARKLGRWFLLPEFRGVDAILGSAGGVLVAKKRRPTNEIDRQPVQIAGSAIFPCIVETHTGD